MCHVISTDLDEMLSSSVVSQRFTAMSSCPHTPCRTAPHTTTHHTPHTTHHTRHTHISSSRVAGVGSSPSRARATRARVRAVRTRADATRRSARTERGGEGGRVVSPSRPSSRRRIVSQRLVVSRRLVVVGVVASRARNALARWRVRAATRRGARRAPFVRGRQRSE